MIQPKKLYYYILWYIRIYKCLWNYKIIFFKYKNTFFKNVGTAWYRMMPNIKLLDNITGNSALLLQSCFPKGVIGLKTSKGILFKII